MMLVFLITHLDLRKPQAHLGNFVVQLSDLGCRLISRLNAGGYDSFR